LKGETLRLYPLPARELPAESIYEDLELPPPRRGDPSRPYVIVNMVSSLDGRAAVGGKASPIGSETDRRVMRTLRSRADAVMIGAGTLRAEKLSLGLDEISRGAQPLAVIVSQSGDVPLGTNLIVGKGQEVLVITAEDTSEADLETLREHASVLRLPAASSGGVRLEDALKLLEATRSVDLLLVEGGPRLNHSLVSQGLADELFLTLAAKVFGGMSSDDLALIEGPQAPLPETLEAELTSVHLSGDELYLRYRFAR
jgi:2,5-diamino-6-(ribosylamino)-4(3H)-pyrimidinone 5'-phosphate reductase